MVFCICNWLLNNSSHTALKENSSPGDGFLANVFKGWKIENFKADALWVLTVALRLRVILGHDGGITAKKAASFSNATWRFFGERRFVYELDSHPERGTAHSNNLEKPLLPRAYKRSQSSSCKNNEFTSTLAGVLKRPFFRVSSFILKNFF
jgi:NAD dependent epimerase/dehydratase family enzyme